MSAATISGTEIAGEIRDEVARRVKALEAEHGLVPGLATVLVGDDPASRVYVEMKNRDAEEVGFRSRQITLEADTAEEELLGVVAGLDADPDVHGILVQLPLPDPIDEARVLEAVDPAKDVDGFHPVNMGRLASGDGEGLVPCTPRGVIEMLVRSGHDPEGKHAVVVGRSTIVGRPMALLLLRKAPGGNATVTVAHSRTSDLGAITRQADILIVAVGRPETVTGEMVKPGAVVIDVGVNRVDDPEREKGYRLVGDVAFEEVREVASAITPVPGGVGPMTRAMLLRNTVDAAVAAAGVAE
ncbi:MAG: bifunctional methylenetetrahydrofolate dehydrogenase/methenyltetrahydrofolate cyclohydrolase FolD [Gemmatimonadetes bacterium]|nr:bifunctional methylenetetrahydrofolate dehydrogenase/methenyltetrahydrofolate cyclohydrolase FolD [Gemmatimonadota bacterium]NIR78667.1 bifunctional methylenetetrahydrofolate dehydrogenase/methenyltetrahydrofolate cyclohydrolase FolD [Gemmatimonadota bacterium]NIT87288.1 bifunctional methylenetetrahydrofolate dehydrogenase/methenyltetrahydrofolate cyclohydrolase FolD [Gemmatimonadota bacterium]NIU31132.1 bifunctional methylenetetrahydrofolate dehydrogenase/methenyltetrahydrofolate cyclohydrol